MVSGADQPYPGPNPNFEVDGAPLLPTACEGDLTLATALASSCIPIFQRIARQVGLATYVRYVRALRYGNRRVRDAPLDAFWLQGPFGISAREQVSFLERLRRRRAAALASRDDRGARHAARRAARRRGAVRQERLRLHHRAARGWWVGWVQRGRRTWTFALNLDITPPEHLGARAQVGRAILADLGALGP